VCNYDAVLRSEAVNGEWYLSETRFGPMAHAKLGPAEENTGRLVTLVRNKAATMSDGEKTLIDGAPGTGCPVIASITGAEYALIVTEPTVSGVHDMERVAEVAEHFGVRAGVLINKCDLNKEMAESIRSIAKKRGLDIIGMIPYDEDFTRAQMAGLSIVEYTSSSTTQAIKDAWEQLFRML